MPKKKGQEKPPSVALKLEICSKIWKLNRANFLESEHNFWGTVFYKVSFFKDNPSSRGRSTFLRPFIIRVNFWKGGCGKKLFWVRVFDEFFRRWSSMGWDFCEGYFPWDYPEEQWIWLGAFCGLWRDQHSDGSYDRWEFSGKRNWGSFLRWNFLGGNVNEVIRTISSLFIFFYEKILGVQNAPKRKTNHFHPQVFVRAKNCCCFFVCIFSFCWLVFFCNLFLYAQKK